MGSVLDNKGNYNNGSYEYGLGGKGKSDGDKDGRKEIDCSNLVNQLINSAGYDIPYETTKQLHESNYYEHINPADVQPGDIIIWNGHVGVVESFDPITGTGTFFGSQTSTGPATARFGGSADYWKSPDMFLRPKAEYGGGSGGGNEDPETPNEPPPEGSGGESAGEGAAGGAGVGGAKAGSGGTTLPRRDPLALDLDGDGLETTSTSDGAVILFDHDADGVKTGTGWVKPDDGWLVLDHNNNGTIDSGRELFGVDTIKSNGQLASDGFDALRDLDGDANGKIDSADTVFTNLRIWRDLNQDGISQANELTTLNANGIVSIGVESTAINIDLGNGNTQTALGSFTRTNGTVGSTGETNSAVANLDLLSNTFYRQFTDQIPLTELAINLPALRGSGQVRDLSEAISLSSELGSWVESYTQQTTRQDQIDMLDGFIEKWANTSDMKSLKEQADALAANGVSLTYNLAGLIAGTPAYTEFLRKLGIVERFMGFTYGGANGQARLDPLDAFSGALSVTLASEQIHSIALAYERFKIDIYESLLPVTRLANYVEFIERAVEGEITFRDAEVLMAQSILGSGASGYIDLIEFVSAYGYNRLLRLGWNATEFLITQLNNVSNLGEFSEELSSWTVRFAAIEQSVTGTSRADLIVATDSAEYLWGQNGDDILLGKGGNDDLYGGSGNDVLSGGAGADHLNGEVGDDTYIYETNDGVDYIADNSGSNTIRIMGYTSSELSFKQYMVGGSSTEAGLVVYANGVELMTYLGGYVTHVTEGAAPEFYLKEIILDDGVVLSAEEVLDRARVASAGNDTLIADPAGSTIDGQAGWDYILGGLGNDTLSGGDGFDFLMGGHGDDLIYGGSDNDDIYLGEGIDTATGGSGDDWISGDVNDTAVYNNGDGRDKVFGVGTLMLGNTISASDINYYQTGNSLNLTFKNNYTGAVSLQNFFLSNPTNFVFQNGDTAPATLPLSSGIYSDITNGAVNTSRGVRFRQMDGSEGSDWLIANTGSDFGVYVNAMGGDDVIVSSGYADYLVGGAGSDTYFFNKGFGFDYVNEFSSDTGADKLVFGDGIFKEDVLIGYKSGKLALFFKDDASVTVLQYNSIESIEFADGTVWDSAAIQAKRNSPDFLYAGIGSQGGGGYAFAYAVSGTGNNEILVGFDQIASTLTGADGNDSLISYAGNDSLDGGAGNDALNSGGGADTLIGDVGNDTLTGGSGADTYILFGDYGVDYGDNLYSLFYSSGADVIDNYDSAGNLYADRIVFTSGNLAANARLIRSGNDLTVAYGWDHVLIKDQFRDEGTAQNQQYAIDTIVFNDGTAWDSAAISSNAAINSAGDMTDVLAGGRGADVINALNGDDTVFGGDGNDTLFGGAGADVLFGDSGSDVLTGGLGDDTFIVDSAGDVITELFDEGTDAVGSYVTYALSANIENIYLIGSANINAFGNDLVNFVGGNWGSNILDGGAGADTLVGLQGNDTYIADNEADVVYEYEGEGIDTVQSSVSYALGDNLENLTLIGSSNINATGNASTNVLTGNGAANTLDGGAGADTLIGGAGNDVYIIDVSTDVITENANEGTDTVNSAITYTLVSNLENLTLTGTSAINGTGNTLDNALTGNSAANTLTAGSGNDVLDGGAGTDRLVGGTGNDTYYIDVSTDVVVENASEGTDTVNVSFTYTLGSNLENLTLTGVSAINGTGNTLNNIITGNSANNTLSGGTGADTLIGGAGDDSYVVDNAADVITENANEGTDSITSSVTYTLSANVENLTLNGTSAIHGTGNASNNRITGNSGANTLTGNAGNDVLNGMTGADRMVGGIGDDTYYFDNASDVIVENSNEGIDTVNSSLTLTLGNNVENLILTGTTALNGTGNTLNNALTGNSAANTLTGAAGDDVLNGLGGTDRMVGGTGNDTYFVDVSTDVLVENASEGTDTVNSAVTLTLAANFENLTLTGAAAINGTGNSAANVLAGNGANNTLTGAAGNDTYVFGRGGAADTIVDTDSTSGNTDVLSFLSGVATDQVWFRHVGNNLEVSIIGTSDKVTITNWYAGNANHVEQFKTADGKLLLDSQVENLVSAMAAFAPPGAGQTTLPTNYQNSLNPVIAANWQ